MKRTAKLISLILAALTIALAFASCGETAAPESTTAAAASETLSVNENETTVEDNSPKFPEANYNGAEFRVYFRDQTASHYRGMYIIPLEDSVDVIDEEAEKRNIIVEEKYNVKFVALEASAPSNSIKNDLAAGSSTYDIVLEKRKELGPLAMQGCFTNLKNLNVDFTTAWWDANAADAYELAGKLYLMPNDVSVSNLAGCRFYYFNKSVLEDFKLTSPYEYAEKNEWTLDTFIQLVKGVSAPSTDGSLGVYGLANEDGSVRNHTLTGMGVNVIEKNADGTLECKLGTEYAEKAQDYFEKIKALLSDKSYCLTFDEIHTMDAANASAYIDKYTHSRGCFAQDHFLFTQSSMACANEFAEMSKGFGVIMNPKYNADQEKYYHKMDGNAIIWGIPADNSLNLEMISTVMDFWGYTSHNTVMEMFYEVTLKAKRASDPTAASMLDTIKASIGYSIIDIYSIDTSGIISAAYNGSVATAWKQYKTPMAKLIDKVYTTIDALD